MENLPGTGKVFMTAAWKRLINITYAVSPALLEPLLPQGVTPDCIDGKAFVSLVPFSFEKVAIKNIRIPFHGCFPEINLRFYVKHRLGRGVVFIQECAPKGGVVWMARKFFNEPYCKMKMQETVQDFNDGTFSVTHSLYCNGEKNEVTVTARKTTFLPDKNTSDHYFKELTLGFGKGAGNKTMLYRIEHPEWEMYPLVSYGLSMNFGSVFGNRWAFLSNEKPVNVAFVKGSDVVVRSILPLAKFC